VTEPRDPGRASRRTFLVVSGIGVLVACVVARFVTRSPLWLDEALSVHIAELPLADIGEALRHDGHPPLYYWLLHGWLELVGDGDAATRALSGLLAVAALPLAWVAGCRLGGRRTGGAALLILATSPFAVRYATETRMYALVSLLVLAGHLLVRRAVDERSVPRARMLALAVLSGALALTQYWSLFLLAATAACLAWWGRRRGTAARRTAGRLVVAIAAGGIAFVPWLPAFLEQAAHTGTPWATAPRPTVVLDQTLRDLGGGTIAEGGLLAAALVVLLLIGVLGRPTPSGLVIGSRPAPGMLGEAAVVGLTLAVGAAVGLASGSTYASRYASVVLPLVVLVAARGLAVLPGRRAPLVAAAVVLVLAAAGIVENVTAHRTQARAWVDAARAEVGPDDAFVACPDQLGPALRRTLDQDGLASVPVLAYPTLDDGRLVDWYDYAERNDAAEPAAVAAEVLARVPAGGRVWVVWNGAYRTFEGDCEALLNALSVERGGFRTLVPDQGEAYFEHGALVVFEVAG
jgi:mannosyltransferase